MIFCSLSDHVRLQPVPEGVKERVPLCVPFCNLWEVAARTNGIILNIINIGKFHDVDFKTVQNYFSILEDTMLSLHLPHYHSSVRERQVKKNKFFQFVLGLQGSKR